LSNSTRGIALVVNNQKNGYISKNDDINVPGVKRFYTLSLVSNTVTPGSTTPETYRAKLTEAGLEDKEISALVEESRQILERLAEIQTLITGDTYIREAMDNA
jgi:hypothetical protein